MEVEIGAGIGVGDDTSSQAGNDRKRKAISLHRGAEIHAISPPIHNRKNILPNNGELESLSDDRHRNEFVEPHFESSGRCSVLPTAAATPTARLPAKLARSVIFALLSSGKAHTEFNQFAE